ncbi:DMT family transporter [Candidatus Bipolaricaulota bacterium]|nr:DMT family transporter [Candidatus Bipolaricaulota bacterium]TFH09971.1 MAG: DMT family transporter [Candidatus Atribacteria bacterium]
MKSTSMVRVYAALFSAMAIWGLSFLAIKDVIETIPIFSLLFARFLLATLLLGAMGLARKALRLPKRDLLTLAGLALLSPVGYFLFETYGVFYTQPSHVSVIIATIPIAVYLIAFARRQERLTWLRSAGILIAYSGVLVIIGWGKNDPGASLFGDVLVLGAVLCAATRTTLIKDALRRVTPLQLTFYQFFFSLFVFGPLALTDGVSWMGQVTTLTLLELLFLGVFCSAGAFLFMHYALNHLSATQVAVSANLVPVITLFAEVAILGAMITVPKALGITITLVGVLLTQLDRSSNLPARLDYDSVVPNKPTIR